VADARVGVAAVADTTCPSRLIEAVVKTPASPAMDEGEPVTNIAADVGHCRLVVDYIYRLGSLGVVVGPKGSSSFGMMCPKVKTD
jgi:hypothetical protein